MSKWRYQNMINKAMAKAGLTLDYIEVNDDPTNAVIIATVAEILGSTAADYTGQLADIQAAGIMDDQLAAYFADSAKQPQAAEVDVYKRQYILRP